MRIESDILAGPGQGEIDAAAALVANREITLPEDGHVMGTGVVVGVHHAVDAIRVFARRASRCLPS